LRALLERHRPLEPLLVLAIVRQVAACLAEAHAASIVHRDLKPENVFLCPAAKGPFVKVLDFGLAKLVEPTPGEKVPPITLPSLTVGTPAYLAPEMAVTGRRGDARSDLYALGVMTYEMLVGERPFKEKTPSAMMKAHTSAPIPQPSLSRPQVPAGCDAFMTVALAKDPEDRFQDAEAFAVALGGALGERRRDR
jgi:serine/threonine-protein kinase